MAWSLSENRPSKRPSQTRALTTRNSRAWREPGSGGCSVVRSANWYSVSWPMKLYLDHWSAWMRVPSLAFGDTLKGRNLWAVIVDSDEDPTTCSADPVIDTMRKTAEYMEMKWHGALLGHANKPGEIAADTDALEEAATYLK